MQIHCNLWVSKSDCATSVVAGYCGVAVQKSRKLKILNRFLNQRMARRALGFLSLPAKVPYIQHYGLCNVRGFAVPSPIVLGYSPRDALNYHSLQKPPNNNIICVNRRFFYRETSLPPGFRL